MDIKKKKSLFPKHATSRAKRNEPGNKGITDFNTLFSYGTSASSYYISLQVVVVVVVGASSSLRHFF